MVRLVGWRGLGLAPTEERYVKAVIDRSMQRIAVMTGDVLDMSIRVKKASKTGAVHRYEIMLAVATNDKVYHASATEWQVVEAVQHAFANIERQVSVHVGRLRQFHRETVYPPVI